MAPINMAAGNGLRRCGRIQSLLQVDGDSHLKAWRIASCAFSFFSDISANAAAIRRQPQHFFLTLQGLLPFRNELGSFGERK
jgi:hypothetical protein